MNVDDIMKGIVLTASDGRTLEYTGFIDWAISRDHIDATASYKADCQNFICLPRGVQIALVTAYLMEVAGNEL